MGDLYLETRAHLDSVDIDLVGPLTSRTVGRVRAALRPHCSAVSRVRLHNCTDIDLDAVFALLAADIEAGEAGGQIRLVDVPPLIARYLHEHRAGHLLDPPAPRR